MSPSLIVIKQDILNTVLAVSGLGKKYGRQWIFRNLEFALETGDCLIVQGRNGVGKSTLLKILADLEKPTEGEVISQLQDYRNDLSYCALDQSVFPNLTVLEHLQLSATMRGINVNNEELIVRTGLATHTNHQAQFLSSGLRSRLKIALAIQSAPKLLLWDEPGVALDEAGKQLISDVIAEQKKRGALVIATNDASERRFGTHAVELT